MTHQGSLEGKPPCPRCRRVLDAFTSIDGARDMQPGDYSVCGYCAAPLRWDGLAYLPLTGSELVLARLRDDFVTAEAIARKAREEHVFNAKPSTITAHVSKRKRNVALRDKKGRRGQVGKPADQG